MTTGREAVHRDPIWRDRANFLIGVAIDAGDTDIDTEQLWARKVNEGLFEVCCIPFFAIDLALGDVVEVDLDYLFRRVVSPSGRYVFRVYFAREQLDHRDEIVFGLTERGALVEWSSPNMFAVDARDAMHAKEIADYLCDKENLGQLVYETRKSAAA